MKLICSIAIVVVSLSLGSIAANAQADQGAIIRSLQSPNSSERYAAVQQALEIPPSERTEMLWVAVANELEPMQQLSHSRTDDLVNGRAVPEVGEEFSRYTLEDRISGETGSPLS